MESLVEALRKALVQGGEAAQDGPRRCPSCCPGAPPSPAGFQELFEKTLRSKPLPIEIAEVRMARDPLTATARGALIAAMYEK